MSLSLTYDSFKNQVPTAFRSLKCRGFKLRIPTESSFKTAKDRVLVVIGRVPTDDLIAGRLLSTPQSKEVMAEVLAKARTWASNFGKPLRARYSFINYNYFKSYHLQGDAQATANKANRKRLLSYIKKVKPQLVIVFGDEAATSILGSDVEKVGNKRGWVHDFPVIPGLRLVSTIEWDSLLPKPKDSNRQKVDAINMIGYMSRNIASGLIRKHPLSLHAIKPRPFLVDTMEKFENLMEKLDKSRVIAMDSETNDLTVLKNKLLMIQFAASTKRGYVLPVDHKDTPFTGKQIRKIKLRLREFLVQRIKDEGTDTRCLVTQNGGFDVRVLRECLKIPVVHWPLWDAMAGEFGLDENIDSLKQFETSPWGLAAILCSYNNDWYYTAPFSKSQRHTIADSELDENVLNYASMDVQSLIGIREAQIAQAALLDFEGKSYQDMYKRFMIYQMGNNIHMMSSMNHRGNLMDRGYLIHIASKQGPLVKLINQVESDLYKMPSVKRVNAKLVADSGVPQKGLFGKVSAKWVFSLSVEDHKQALFIEELDLSPLKEGASGRASLDKFFQEEYKDVPEVGLLRKRNKIQILRNTFAKGILKNMASDPDAIVDGRLRPQYGYTNVLTGRSNSYKPSLQQIPERSAEAKIIKRMFITEQGKLHIKLDYSSHEVRGWGIISKDSSIAATFQAIHDLVYGFRKHQTKERKLALKEGGDLHKINYSLFTGVPVSKVTDDQRAAAKGMCFGSIYGMSARSLGESIDKSTKEAQSLQDLFFSKFRKAAKWLEEMRKYAIRRGYVYAPTGRRRNLPGAFISDERLSGAIGRRADNSPIQGMCSDFGFLAARLIELAIYKVFKKLGRKMEVPKFSAGVMQMVHDSIKVECEYRDFFILMWIMEYCAIHGVREFVEKSFGFKFNVDLAVEFEIGSMGDKMGKWDWSDEGLYTLLKDALETQKKELGYDLNVKKTLRLIYEEGQKHSKYLQNEFPLPVPILKPDNNYWETRHAV